MSRRLPLLAVLLLATLLLAAGAAHGSPIASAAAEGYAFEEPLEEELSEEIEEVETECDRAHEEADEGERGRAEAEEICEEAAEESSESTDNPSGQAPEECILRSAHANAVVNDKSNKLKLTLGYTTYEPVAAKIKVGNIAKLQRQLGRSGVLRFVKPLRIHQHLSRLVVRIDLPSVKRAGCPSRRLVLFPR